MLKIWCDTDAEVGGVAAFAVNLLLPANAGGAGGQELHEVVVEAHAAEEDGQEGDGGEEQGDEDGKAGAADEGGDPSVVVEVEIAFIEGADVLAAGLDEAQQGGADAEHGAEAEDDADTGDQAHFGNATELGEHSDAEGGGGADGAGDDAGADGLDAKFHRCRKAGIVGGIIVAGKLEAGEDVDAVSDAEAQEDGGKDDAEQLQVTDGEGGEAEGPGNGVEQGDGGDDGHHPTVEGEDENGGDEQEGDDGGDGAVTQGGTGFVGFHDLDTGEAGLEGGVIFDGGLEQLANASDGATGGVDFAGIAPRLHAHEQEAAVSAFHVLPGRRLLVEEGEEGGGVGLAGELGGEDVNEGGELGDLGFEIGWRLETGGWGLEIGGGAHLGADGGEELGGVVGAEGGCGLGDAIAQVLQLGLEAGHGQHANAAGAALGGGEAPDYFFDQRVRGFGSIGDHELAAEFVGELVRLVEPLGVIRLVLHKAGIDDEPNLVVAFEMLGPVDEARFQGRSGEMRSLRLAWNLSGPRVTPGQRGRPTVLTMTAASASREAARRTPLGWLLTRSDQAPNKRWRKASCMVGGGS